MSRYELAQEAIADLADIRAYIAQDSVAAATRLLRKLRNFMQDLADTPGIGRSREELSVGLRSFAVGSYVIYCSRNGKRIRILRVLHGVWQGGRLVSAE